MIKDFYGYNNKEEALKYWPDWIINSTVQNCPDRTETSDEVKIELKNVIIRFKK